MTAKNPGEPQPGEPRSAPQTKPSFLVSFLFRLREFGVPAGVSEMITLAGALRAGLHDDTLDGFYYAARAIVVHHEGHLDAFDQAFSVEFRGGSETPSIKKEMLDWLAEAAAAHPGLTDEELAALRDIDIDELRKQFAERLAEQTERHDGGNYWIGTGGTSPFGRAGAPRPGIRVGPKGGNRSAVQVADARQFRGYRSDVTLDVRQLEVALRRLRSFIREGAADELDVEATIARTARNAGEIEVVTRPPSKPNTHLILMIDVGGSMFPYSELMSRLFSATKQATHFKELRTYYFHNCVYGEVYETDSFTDPKPIMEVIRECGTHYKLIMVGDALMAPYELFGPAGGGWAPDSPRASGFDSLQQLRAHFNDQVWLNPESESRWAGTTIEAIAGLFDMFPLTLDGLTEAMKQLNRGGISRA